MKARDLDTLMSVIAVFFVAACFFLLPGRDVKDICLVGLFIASPTKFIAIARIAEIAKGPNDLK